MVKGRTLGVTIDAVDMLFRYFVSSPRVQRSIESWSVTCTAWTGIERPATWSVT